MIIESELRQQIAHVVANHAPLAELYRWLMAHNWNVLRNSDASAAQLAVDVEDSLVEWSDGLQPESEVIQSLTDLLNNIAVTEPVEATPAVLQYVPFVNSAWSSAGSLPVAA